jgi:hypothetical protein
MSNTPKWYNEKTARETANPAILAAILGSGGNDRVTRAAAANPASPAYVLEKAGHGPRRNAGETPADPARRPFRPSSRLAAPDDRRYKHKFEITGSTGRIYRLSYDDAPGAGYWTCSCPGNITHGDCKHLRACGLMGRKQSKALGIRAPEAVMQLEKRA